MGRVYDIDPKALHAKFFEFESREVSAAPKEDPEAKMKAEAEELKKQNAALRANKA